MANPTKVVFVEPTQNTDGSPFDRSQLDGYVISFDDGPYVEADEIFLAGGTVEVLLATFNLPFGQHTVRVRTRSKNGSVSAPTNPASFELKDERVPNPPTSLRVE
jgi:hypothetical protein